MTRIKNVRQTTKFKRSIKAISPVIATLLMIAIAVVASLVVYAWVTGYIGGTTSTAGKAIQIQSFASVGGNLVVYVQNVGQADVELNRDQSIYVDSVLVPITSPADLKIPIAQGDTIALQTSTPYTAGTRVNIKVTTTDGTFMTITGTGSSTVPVSHGAVTGITVTPASASVMTGATQTYVATASDGSTTWDVSTLATWSVTPTAGGTFSGNVLTAGTVNTGYTVAATYSSVSGNTPLTVTAVHPQVTFVAAGTGSGGTGNLAPTYPAGLQANDLLLLQVTVNDGTTTPTTPSGGWVVLYGPDNVPGTGTASGKQWIYYKFTTGTETSPLTVTIGGMAAKSACIYAFRNVATGAPANFAESAIYAGSPTTPASTIPASSVTTTGAKELAVSFNYVQADYAIGIFTPSTGGTWAQPTGGLTRYNNYGYQGAITMQLQTATMANAGTISGGTTANYGVQYLPNPTWYYSNWGVRAFALKPA